MEDMLLFPLKILAVPMKFIAGMIGVFIAACVNAWFFRAALCWCAWNFGWAWVTNGILIIVAIVCFLFTFVAAGKK